MNCDNLDHALTPHLVDGMASITVTYNPDIEVLRRQLSGLSEVKLIVLVDNGSAGNIRAAIDALVTRMPAVHLIVNPENVGLAAALNIGIQYVRGVSTNWTTIFLLDQDSTFPTSLPGGLIDALNRVEHETGKLCCVGPYLVDRKAGMTHGFHIVANGWRWSRAYPAQLSSAGALPVATLNGSGTLASLKTFEQVGPLDESLFIDHVDTEWSFRASTCGCGLYGIPWLSMDHAMGEASQRIWFFGWRLWPFRSPQRHYYLFRNTMVLLRRSYVPILWKIWAVVKLVVDVSVTSAVDTRRASQLRLMFRGLRDGTRHR